jgi:hypothetical protein
MEVFGEEIEDREWKKPQQENNRRQLRNGFQTGRRLRRHLRLRGYVAGFFVVFIAYLAWSVKQTRRQLPKQDPQNKGAQHYRQQRDPEKEHRGKRGGCDSAFDGPAESCPGNSYGERPPRGR